MTQNFQCHLLGVVGAVTFPYVVEEVGVASIYSVVAKVVVVVLHFVDAGGQLFFYLLRTFHLFHSHYYQNFLYDDVKTGRKLFVAPERDIYDEHGWGKSELIGLTGLMCPNEKMRRIPVAGMSLTI